MRKFTTICLTALIAVLFFARCNSDVEYPNENISSSVAVYSFGLSADDKVLANLDTVYFSINLNEGTIFNGDSLPYGTPVKRLVPKIVMLESVSTATLTVPGDEENPESVHDFIENPGDSIDFSGPVYLDVKSPDGLVSRRYTIKVNVHKLVSDSLVWDRAAVRTLPGNIEYPGAQRTASTAEGYYCLTTDRSTWCMAHTDCAYGGEWEISTPAMPALARIETFAGTEDALYILDEEGNLHRSADGGASWTATGCHWNFIYGSVGGTLLGNVLDNGVWKLTSYPAEGSDGLALPASMPVRATSQLVDFSFPLSNTTQAVMVGGVRADGSRTGAVWAYDGASWAELNGNFAMPLENVTLLPFFTFRMSNTLVATESSIIMAVGGIGAEDEINDSIYVTSDFGLTWSKAPELMQLPEYLPRFYGAQAFVEEATLGARSASAWREMPFAYRLPATAVFDGGPFAFDSRATRPIESWECPFIYLFGGYNRDGELHNTLWRATLNRFTFKPIQ